MFVGFCNEISMIFSLKKKKKKKLLRDLKSFPSSFPLLLSRKKHTHTTKKKNKKKKEKKEKKKKSTFKTERELIVWHGQYYVIQQICIVVLSSNIFMRTDINYICIS
jgi:hypothetical protein